MKITVWRFARAYGLLVMCLWRNTLSSFTPYKCRRKGMIFEVLVLLQMFRSVHAGVHAELLNSEFLVLNRKP